MLRSLACILRVVAALALLAPAVDAKAQNVARGKEIYDAVCATCHGPNPGDNIYGIVTVGANNANAILNAWVSFPDMNFLLGIFGPSDRTDLAAYLGTFANAPPPTPGVIVGPSIVLFASTPLGAITDATTVILNNLGGLPVTVTDITTSAPAEFIVAATSCATVAPGGTCAALLRFKPASAGLRNGVLIVTSSGLGSPLSIAIFGTGVATVGQLQAAASLPFASQPLGTTSAAQSVAVQNIGSAPVAIAAIASNSPEFVVSAGTCAGSLAAGASCQFAASFAPSATGARSATITIASDGIGAPNAIAASGTGAPPAGPQKATVIEYYHAAFDHYFITAIADEITKLDNGTFAGWTRTNRQFDVYAQAGAGLAPVCRFFSTAFAPKSSHFYTPFASECATVKSSADWTFEGEVFNVALPDAGGSCPAGTIAVYRVYNNGQGAAPNHRYTTDLQVRQQMLDKGYVPEGLGAVGVIWCSPS